MSKTNQKNRMKIVLSKTRHLFKNIKSCFYFFSLITIFIAGAGCGKSNKNYDQKVVEARAAMDNHSFAQAVDLLKDGAEKGHVQSQALLGVCYMMLGQETDGVQWIRKAAEAGDKLSQFNLAKCYDQGIGLQKNFYERDHWGLKAKAQGVVLETTTYEGHEFVGISIYDPFKY